MPERVGVYDIEGILGRGGMGVVYRGRDPAGRPVAVKCIETRDDRAARRLLREASVRVVHRNVVRVLAAGLDARGEPFVVTELLEGESLRERLERRGCGADEILALVAQAAEGLAALHAAGVVHRDVKPSNLFVTKGGTLKLLDFGAATFADASTMLTHPGALVGTPPYLSPEQARGGVIDARADVWGAGMCLYHALTGELPFRRESVLATVSAVQHTPLPPLRERAPSVPPEVAALVERCLAKRPEDRVQTAAELARLLRELSGSLATIHAHAGASSALAAAPTLSLPSGAIDGAPSLARRALPMHEPIELGPFVLEEEAGRGGMAVVYRARHPDGARVAIKVPVVEGASARRFVAAFHDEARAIAALDHPAVVRLYDYGVVTPAVERASGGSLRAGVPWIAMEWASGGTLAGRSTAASWADAHATLATILDALAHVHARGIVHRDLKPANVLVCTEADGAAGLRLTDFGFVLGRGSTAPLRGGTPAFMAPEQWEGRARQQGPWTDLFALGVLAWKLVTGVLPGSLGERVLTPAFPVPEGLAAWLGTLLAPAPRDRFQRAADAARALERLGGEPASPPLPSSWRTAHHVARRFPANVGRGVVHLRPVPIAGRAHERDVLWSALGDVLTSGRPRAVALVGGAGLGKTRLLEWLLHRAAELGAADALAVTHHASLEPADGIVAMLARAIRVEGLDGEALSDAIADALPDLPRDDRDALAILLSGGVPLESARPRDRRVLVARALASLQRPLIVGIDDAQWGEEALALALELLDDGASRILVVVAVRDDALAERAAARAAVDALLAHERAAQVVLEPLSREAQGELVRHALGLDASAALSIEERTGGNPAFAMELVTDWLRSGVLEPAPDGFRLARSAPELPADLAAAWRGRADRVLSSRAEHDLRAIEIAALLGESPDPAEWEAACAAAGVQPAADLIDVLASERLVRRLDGERWAFAHGMLREAMISLAEPRHLARHHEACIEALCGREGQEARLGRHLLLAGSPERAVVPLLAAVERFVAMDDDARVASALADAEAASASLPESSVLRGEVRRHAISAARRSGRMEWALHACETLLADVERHGWTELSAPVRLQLAHVLTLLGDGVRALGELDRAERERVDPALRVPIQRQRAHALVWTGDLERASAVIAAVLADPLASRRDLAWARHLQGDVLRLRGQAHEAVRVLEAALDHARGLRWHYAATLNSLADAVRATGDLAGADRRYQEAIEHFHRIASADLPIVELNRAIVMVIREQWSEAREILARLVPTFERNRRLTPLVAALAFDLVVRAARAEWGAFDAEISRVEELLAATRYVETDLMEAFQQGAALAARAGEGERAERLARLAAKQREAIESTRA